MTSTTDKIHVVCPHCHTTNRVAANQLVADPACGQCKQPLFAGQPLVLADVASFDKHAARSQIPLLVDFWAPWCGPCRIMAPAYEQAAAQLEPQFRVAKVDTDAVPELGGRYQVRSIPTLALFRDGRLVARQAGALSTPGAIVSWAREHAG